MTDGNNKKNEYGLLNDLKMLMVGSGYGLMYFLLAVMLVCLNLYFVPSILFNPSDGWFDEEDIFYIGFYLINIVCLLGIFIFTPRCMRSKIAEEGGERSVSPLIRVLSLWLPFFGCVVFETLVGVVCSLIVGSRGWHFYDVLVSGLGASVILLLSAIACAILFYASGLVRWYVLGLVTLNFAPYLIADGLLAIRAACLMRATADLNYLYCNVFFSSIGLLALIAVCVTATLLLRRGKDQEAVRAKITLVYKTVVTVVFSVALSLFLTKGLIGMGWGLSAAFVINYLLWSIIPAGLISWFAFKKDRRIKHLVITLIIMALIGLLIVGIIPLVLKGKMLPPKEDKIEACTISISQVGDIGGIGDCAELHGELLELFRQGYSPDKYGEAYKKPECIADYWSGISFSYKLKNGRTEYYAYKNLNDKVFDEYYISVMKSDAYEKSLVKSTSGVSDLSYYSFGTMMYSFDISESETDALFTAYCKELKNAESDAFYERCDTIKLRAENGSGYIHILVPASFKNTLSLLREYNGKYN